MITGLLGVLCGVALQVQGGPPTTLPSPAVPKAAAPSPPREKTYRYYEVPIVGEFGKEIQPSGVEDALETAVKQKVDFIVFRIKSGGGMVASARQIAETLARFDSALDYVAVIEGESLSATLSVALSCDHIFMTHGSTIGGAVAFTPGSTGEVAVDAKFNSIWAAELASIAENKRHSPVLTRAMVLLESKAYLIDPDSVANRRVSADPPTAGIPFQTLDTETTILTMTTDEAVRTGFASLMDGRVDDLGPKLGMSKWDKKGNYGQVAMKKAHDAFVEATRLEARLEDLLNSRPAVVRFILANTDDARAKDPENFTYYYEVGILENGRPRFTQQSKSAWLSNTDAAINAWQRVMNGIRALAKLDEAAAERGEAKSSDQIDLQDHFNRASREIERLQANRSGVPRM